MVLCPIRFGFLAAISTLALGTPLIADPSGSAVLSPVLSISGREADPEHMNNPYEAAVIEAAPTIGRAADAALARLTGSEAAFAVSPDSFPEGPDPAIATGSDPFRDYHDTLVRTEMDSRVETFVSESGERFPDSWSNPPGLATTGGHPGSRRDADAPDYSRPRDGISYFPPPSVPSGAAPSRDGSSYDPAGPYAYRYEGLAALGDPPERGQWDFDGGFDLFDRSFDPYQADFKAGPVYFEAVSLETGLLYSDYHGPQFFAPDEEDGWLSFVSLHLRMATRIGPSLYLLADGEIIYLPGSNRVGFRSGLGLGVGPFARIGYETEIGGWDFRAYAEFGTGSFDAAVGNGRTAYERAGNYSFGITGRGNEDLFYAPYLYTTIGVEAGKQVQPDWRVRLIAEHSDYWYVGDDRDLDEGRESSDRFGFLYESLPGEVPFSPYFSYDAYSYDQFDSVYHTAYVGGSGRLSPNVFADARIGYLWSGGEEADYQSQLWDVGLRHRINDRTWQEVRFGEDYVRSDFTSDSAVSRYARYSLSRRVSERILLEGYAQWSEDDYLSGRFAGDGLYRTEMYGARAYIEVNRRTSLDFGYRIENSSTQDGLRDYERGLFDARLETRVTDRSTVYFYYQHDDTDLYFEDLYMAGYRRSF